MKFSFAYFMLFAMLFVAACKKDNNDPNNTPKPLSDFGVTYSEYAVGSVYTNDTFQTKFTITNYGPSSFETGDTLFAAVKINKVVYGLDLLGSGPTPIVLTQPLPASQTYQYNPGYLLRTPTLAYFALDTLDITILLYGKSGSPIDTTFPSDPTPANNKAVLRLTTNNHFIVP